MSRGELPSLTGVRALAALFVFGFHVVVVGYATGPLGAGLRFVFGGGSAGVSLFFVLSGFVLAWSHDDRTTTGDFLLRRFARVWPSHAVWVVVAVATAAVVPVLRHPGGGAVGDLANTGLVSAWVPSWWQDGNPVAWSLVCEAFFYAMFPLVWRGLRSVRRRTGFVAVAAVSYTAVWLLPFLLTWSGVTPSSGAALHFPVARLPEFVLGVLAAVAVRRNLWQGPGLAWAGVVAVASCVAARWVGTAPGVTVAGFVLVVAALARRDRDGRPTVLAGRVAGHLGRVSFAFYLCHLLVIGVLGAWWSGGRADGHPRLGAAGAVGLIALALFVSLVLAELTHRFVEQPARRRVLTIAEVGLRARSSRPAATVEPAASRGSRPDRGSGPGRGATVPADPGPARRRTGS